jgi:chloramphenicol 3-O phosphotransferase
VLKQKLRDSGADAAVISLDDYLQMSAKEPIWEDDVFAVMPLMCRDIAAALQAGKTLIVDHVITSPRIYGALTAAVKGFSLKTILVSCDPGLLRKREAARGDRCIGSAEASLQYLYPKTGYDLSVDSGEMGAEALAERILGIV